MTFWQRIKLAWQILLGKDQKKEGPDLDGFMSGPAYRSALRAVDKVFKDISLAGARDSVKYAEAVEWAIRYYQHHEGDVVPVWGIQFGVELAVGVRRGKL